MALGDKVRDVVSFARKLIKEVQTYTITGQDT